MSWNLKGFLVLLGFLALAFVIHEGVFYVLLLVFLLDWLNSPKSRPLPDTDHLDVAPIDPTDDYNPAYEIFMYTKSRYMKSPEWQTKRQAKLAQQPTCQVCGTRHSLQVHHLRDYSLIPHEPLSSLAVLCNVCHQLQHDALGYPQTYQDYMNWNVNLVYPNKDTP